MTGYTVSAFADRSTKIIIGIDVTFVQRRHKITTNYTRKQITSVLPTIHQFHCRHVARSAIFTAYVRPVVHRKYDSRVQAYCETRQGIWDITNYSCANSTTGGNRQHR